MSIGLEELRRRRQERERDPEHGEEGRTPSGGAARERIPFGWIQWKGTDVCMDVHCRCGAHLHLDDQFAYYIQCPHCDQVYACGEFVELQPLAAPPNGCEAIRLHPDGDLADDSYWERDAARDAGQPWLTIHAQLRPVDPESQGATMTEDELSPEPEPEWMTDEELAELERDFANADADGRYHMADRIPALIAELRRLRAEWWKDHLMG